MLATVADLRSDWLAVGGGSVRRTAHLAGFAGISDVDTAYVHVAGRAWGPLFGVVGFTLLLANFGSGMGAQLGAARLLYGMGRSQRAAKIVFWRSGREASRSTQQCFLCGRDRPDRSVLFILRARRGDAEFLGIESRSWG